MMRKEMSLSLWPKNSRIRFLSASSARRDGRSNIKKLFYNIAVELRDILVLGDKGYLGDGKHSAEEQHSVGSCLRAAIRKHRHLREFLLDIR